MWDLQGVEKSTLLRMIAGLEEITEGEISIGDEVVNNVIAAERGVAMVFQSYALYPHMTVFENMSFALKQAKAPKDEIQQRVTEAAKILQIENLFERLPKQLSGGQRQRVTLARALIGNPQIIFLDDSTSSVDPVIEKRILDGLRSRKNISLVIVAHRLSTIKLADRVIFLNNGVIEGTGSHEELMRLEAYASLAKAYEKTGVDS